MSEINRVPLKSIGSTKVDGKKIQEVGKTVRIALILPESNEDTCPEYHYKEQLAAAKKNTNFGGPFFDNNDEDDDVRRIAQQMEAKYGASVPSKKKRKGRKDDYADIGAGYDESDSFIDNTDGYDEMIPQNVTTLHGGFYINSGALEFKTDDEASSDISSSSSSEDEREVIHNNTSRKRKLVSSDESEGDNETENHENNLDKKPKPHSELSNGKLPSKKKSISKDEVKHVKKFKTEEKKKIIIKDIFLEEKREMNVSLPPELLETSSLVDIENDKKENKKPMSLDNVNDSIESVIKCSKVLSEKVVDDKNAVEPIINETVNNNNNNNIKPQINTRADDMDNSSNEAPKLESEIVKLPENLPNDILTLIDNIKREANKTKEGKVKFLSGPVSDMLLSLERKFKCLGKQSRMRVYEHLAPFLKCRKETIMKRAKNLVLIDDKKKLMDLLTKLKQSIEKIMPPLLENYKTESQKIMQRKFSKETLENEENKHLRMPKRRFSWTEEIKKLYKELILIKKRCFLLEGKNKNSLESQMENFIKTEVQILWPDGWMSMTALLRLYNNFSESNKQNKSPMQKKVSSSNNTQSQPVNKEIQKITSNATLSIIPVGSNKTSPESNVKNDIVIDKILNESSSSKIKKSLPVDISKTSNSLIITPTTSTNLGTVTTHEDRKLTTEPKKSIINEVIIVEEKQKKTVIEPVSQNNSEIAKKLENKHCQIIDLTENSETRKKPGHKSKTKYQESDDKSSSKPSDIKNDSKEITASVAYNNLIQEYAQNLKTTSSTTISSNKLTDHSIKKLSTPSNYSNSIEHMKLKSSNEGDDIQRVMEGLKALQNMAAPIKAEKSTGSPTPSYAKSDYNSGFQEAFQRQLLNDFHMMKNSVTQSTSSSSKSHYSNSIDKYPHSNNINYSTSYSNNNYSQQNSKMNPSTHQSGTYNVLDDMLSNFLSDYGYPKSANHKQKSSHSHK